MIEETRPEAGDSRPEGCKRQGVLVHRNRLGLTVNVASRPTVYSLQPPALALLCLLASVMLPGIAFSEPPAGSSDEAGFVSLFNGKNLDGWQLRRAERKGYVVEDGLLVCPKDSGGYLFTEKEYSDFVLRFEFRMTEGANSGVAIRTPLLDKKPAYDGTEIQILDNPRYEGKLRPTQYHGSVYDVAPAKLGALKPVGQWNEQEIACQGRRITVTVNGKCLVDVNLDDIKDATVLEKHPGLQRPSGHIGLLGHGSRVEFRNLRVKELKGAGHD